MKKLVLSLIFVLSFAVHAQAHTDAKTTTNVLPEPLPESAGQLIYEEMGCPMCHGYQGGGDGFMSEGLTPKPRNFTCYYTMREIPDGQLFWVIKNGSPGTRMPSFGTMSDEQVWQVILYVRQFAQ